MIKIERLPSPQQISWFLDLNSRSQLNLDPPYQRKSVWTLRDRKFFLDTIFKNYPCPTIFIHKVTNDEGKTTYNVVDGKQRLQTILMFKDDELNIDKDFGDITYDGKKFSQLTPEQKRKFWDYIIVVDFVDLPNPSFINEVFDRLNRNSKNLNEQELRHAKHSGWFITEAEKETENEFWDKIKVSTKAKAKRMKDVQFVSELLMIIIDGEIIGFDQDVINEVYAELDDINNFEPKFDEDNYIKEKERVKKYLELIEKTNSAISKNSTLNNIYTLWSLIALNQDKLPDYPKELAVKYNTFIEKVKSMTDDSDEDKLASEIDKLALRYYTNSRGASTDLKQRTERFESLKKALLDT